jgi:membrane protease subunit (stomatin/prohibitin family)
MALMDFIKKQFIDILQWTEEGDGTLAWRFPVADMEIQYGASLTVRESQMAIFVNEGKVADVFGPGMYKLTTQTIPVLTYLKNWDKLFESPFKSDVYFFSTRTQVDCKWGTPQPITVRDKEFGAVRLRAFGIYSYKIADPKLFHTTISGTRETYAVTDLDGQLRSTMIGSISDAIASSGVPFLDMAANQEEFAAAVRGKVGPAFQAMGLSLESLVVQNISLPEEIQKMLDTRIGMNMIGDMNRYTQYQAANAIPIAAANEGSGMAAMGAQLAAGVGMGNVMANAMGMGLGQQGMVPQQAAPAAVAAAPVKMSIDEVTATLEKLHGLVQKGILSQAEFDTKKADLMSKI